MCKGTSGMFSGTKGSTAYIWSSIVATQETYPGTVLPKSFILKTDSGDIWTHGNATKHMYEDLLSGRGSHASDPKLYTQLMLADYHTAVSKAFSNGFTYNETITVGNWELNIVAPRNPGQLPVVKHARFIKKEK